MPKLSSRKLSSGLGGSYSLPNDLSLPQPVLNSLRLNAGVSVRPNRTTRIYYPPGSATQTRGRFMNVLSTPLRSRPVIALRAVLPPLRALAIRVPNRVSFCLQRKSRREVLFALRRAGFRGSAPKRHYLRRQSSAWRC